MIMARIRMHFNMLKLKSMPRHTIKQATGTTGRFANVLPVLVLVSLLLAGCDSMVIFKREARDYVAGFAGGVAGDEPSAVLVAQKILKGEGSAADAAIAAYFAMSVTLPSAASLGGGGACLVIDREKNKVESLTFMAGGMDGNRPVVPANVRAMYALHAKYGQLPWRQLVAPAENMARFGAPVSRAFARDLVAAQGHITPSSDMGRTFANRQGRLVREGDNLRQLDLAATLSIIRGRPAAFFSGPGKQRIIRAYGAAGMPISSADVDRARPVWKAPITVRRGNQAADFLPTPAGLVGAQAWAMMYRDGAWKSANNREKPHLIAEVSRRSMAGAGRWLHSPAELEKAAPSVVSEKRTEALMASFDSGRKTKFAIPEGGGHPAPVDQGGASVIAADQFGQAVACSFTMNGLMGSVRIAPKTGIIIAARPDPAMRGMSSGSLMVLRYDDQNQLEFMASATGGAAAPITMVTVALRAMLDKQNLEKASRAPRLFAPMIPDQVLMESGNRGLAKTLENAGHRVAPVSAMIRLNGFFCPAGFDGHRSRCELRTDRRGFGFASQL
ncbi:MAG: hypothetical protein HOF95_09355 [Rhodospirillales bacterium]|jgi:gamma-glutamyltranspeptidase / glutathione hydrolase|nr:hypothetical protein [Rhodospirillales bacterium]MBT4006195.1 hypothetical protein [Rhodospirillales bacterium]MBT5075289.1 hypothetical protein [Rhodospirillales bacterium]MBT5114376.1 hypothetical protein [Rhodospirillales bacterium]MBT5672768.1 hypothetical protein [Rhodospirillales bacterium]